VNLDSPAPLRRTPNCHNVTSEELRMPPLRPSCLMFWPPQNPSSQQTSGRAHCQRELQIPGKAAAKQATTSEELRMSPLRPSCLMFWPPQNPSSANIRQTPLPTRTTNAMESVSKTSDYARIIMNVCCALLMVFKSSENSAA